MKSSALKTFIQKAFPVPKSLILSDMAVDISDGELRYFEFSRNRGQLRPKSFGVFDFPRIYVGAPHEKVNDEIATSLESFSKVHKSKFVRAIVHEDEVYVFRVTIPTVNPSEIRSAVEATLEENVPLSPDEAVFEWDVIKVDHEKNQTIVAVSVVSEKTLYEYIDIFGTGGFVPVSFETESRALAQALIPKNDQGTYAVLDIKAHHSVVFVVEKGAVSFSSSLEVGSADITNAIAKTLNISVEEANTMKEEKAFSQNNDDSSLFETMIPVFSIIRDELAKVLIYWKNQKRKESNLDDITEIILSGRDSFLSGFSKYIAITSHMHARTGSVWTNVLDPQKDLPELTSRDSVHYSSLIGSLL